jgi:hypothetical protein
MLVVEMTGGGTAVPANGGLYAAFLLLSIPFGAIVGCLPVMFGTGVLGWLGKFNAGTRLPPLWALAGAAMAGVPAWIASGNEGGDPIAALAIAGALSALAARAGTRWIDEGEHRPPRSYADR